MPNPLFERIVFEGLGDAVKSFNKFGGDIAAVVPKRIQAAVFILQGEIKKQASGGTIGGALTPGRSLSGKGATGKLAQSFTTAFRSSGNDFEGRVGSPLIYARIHEGPDGGGTSTTVKAKKKFLTIPLTGAAARRPAREWGTALQFVQATGKAPVLIEDATGIAQYLLVPSVKIPARRYVTIAMKNAKPRMDKIIVDGIDTAIQKVGD